MPEHSSSSASRGQARRALIAKMGRYAAGSAVATVCSEVTFLALYGGFSAAPAIASGFGWLAGAAPNYWLNRSWTWRRRGRPSLTGEVLPYAGIILGTLLLAAVATSAVDATLSGSQVSDRVRLVLVGGTFLVVYGVVFVLRFVLLDRLFRRAPEPVARAETVGQVSAQESG